MKPELPTPRIWDQLADAAKWSRANQGVLIDTHWIGGNPGNEEVYGWAAWQPGKGLLTPRNPSDRPQVFRASLGELFELPASSAAR